MNDKFTSKLQNLGLNKSEKIAVAVSGGSDSTALCFLCHQAKLKFTPIIVDHGWRKNSAKEAKQVKAYLEKHLKSTKVSILTNKKPIPKTNIEEFLRDVRYELLFDFCKKNGIKKILTAHHLDDQIETFLMRLERGSGLDGLTGIKERNKVKGFELIRPLLDFTKEELTELLKKNKLKWISDPSNENIELTRNNIRKTCRDSLIMN
jgi:tRNA(Ile)-lysidine synthase